MIGTKRPTHGLSITGDGMPLEIIDTATMRKMYGSSDARAEFHELKDSVPASTDTPTKV